MTLYPDDNPRDQLPPYDLEDARRHERALDPHRHDRPQHDADGLCFGPAGGGAP